MDMDMVSTPLSVWTALLWPHPAIELSTALAIVHAVKTRIVHAVLCGHA